MSPPQMSPPMTSPEMSAAGQAPPVKKGMNPLVVVLLVILGLMALGFVGCVVTLGYLARNPGVAIAKLITASNPDAEVLSTDNDSKTIRVRNKKTGEEFTMSFDDVKSGKIKMRAIGKNGEIANVEIGGGAANVPSWVPIYPGARSQGNFTATGNDLTGRGAGGVLAYETSDSADRVVEFYKDKIDGMHMKIEHTFSSNDGGMMMAQDEDEKRFLQVTIGKSSGGSTIGITYGDKK